jgi:hypothetical protein
MQRSLRRQPRSSPATAMPCLPCMTSQPGTGFICATTTRSSRPSPLCASAVPPTGSPAPSRPETARAGWACDTVQTKHLQTSVAAWVRLPIRAARPFRCLVVPRGWDPALLPLPSHQSCERGRELAWISPDQFIGADGDGLRSFGVVPKDQTFQESPFLPQEYCFSAASLQIAFSAFVREELLQVRPRALWMFWDGGPELRAACPQH